MSSTPSLRTSIFRFGVMLITLLACLGVSTVARAEMNSDGSSSPRMQLRMPEPQERSTSLALRRAPSLVSLVPALALEGVIADEHPRSHGSHVHSAFDTAIWQDISAERGPLYCYGPGCVMTFAVVSQRDTGLNGPVLPSVKFINSLGATPAALLSYFITPAKFGAINYRFGLVSAVGGPAFGLRVRW